MGKPIRLLPNSEGKEPYYGPSIRMLEIFTMWIQLEGILGMSLRAALIFCFLDLEHQNPRSTRTRKMRLEAFNRYHYLVYAGFLILFSDFSLFCSFSHLCGRRRFIPYHLHLALGRRLRIHTNTLAVQCFSHPLCTRKISKIRRNI